MPQDVPRRAKTSRDENEGLTPWSASRVYRGVITRREAIARGYGVGDTVGPKKAGDTRKSQAEDLGVIRKSRYDILCLGLGSSRQRSFSANPFGMSCGEAKKKPLAPKVLIGGGKEARSKALE